MAVAQQMVAELQEEAVVLVDCLREQLRFWLDLHTQFQLGLVGPPLHLDQIQAFQLLRQL